MKKLAVTLCIGCSVLSMAGCGSNNNKGSSEASRNTQSSTATTVETTATQEETFDASNGWSENMQNIKDAIVDALGDDYWPDTSVDPDMLEGNFGISSDLYADYLAEVPMISGNVDTILIIKAKDGKLEDVEKAVHAYRDRMVEDTMQYPMNIGKIQASRIETFGDYVCFVQLGGDAVDKYEQSEEAVITECREQNELVLEIISNNISD